MGPTPGPRRRGPRRADAPGTGPPSADGPEPQLEAARKNVRETARLTEHERWLLEQRPPHWG
ncbi:hypothetical protein F7P69_16960 [Cellulosimicrobium funkei]|nr:hypothetical protein [Cellulosimicrobium funkei]